MVPKGTGSKNCHNPTAPTFKSTRLCSKKLSSSYGRRPNIAIKLLPDVGFTKKIESES
jgi:hypothetical protein